MAQGTIKKSAKPNPAKPAKAQKSKGSVTKRKHAKADKIQKKFSAGLVSKTEKLLGEKAGHLELIGKGKKAPKEEKKHKGGSRKFG